MWLKEFWLNVTDDLTVRVSSDLCHEEQASKQKDKKKKTIHGCVEGACQSFTAPINVKIWM